MDSGASRPAVDGWFGGADQKKKEEDAATKSQRGGGPSQEEEGVGGVYQWQFGGWGRRE